MRTLSATALIALLIAGCATTLGIQSAFPTPRGLPPSEVPRIIRAIPSYTRFGYSGLAFFNGKLFASSNIGLLEYEGGSLSRLYKWNDKDDVVSGPWFDEANKSLWAFHNGIGKLIRFSGETWNAADLPRSKEGYTRGDMLRGFRGVSTASAFWLEGGSRAWRWETDKNIWVNEPTPETGLFVSVIPLNDRKFLLMRHRYAPYIAESPFNRPDKPNSDIPYFLQDGQWRELPDKSGIKFFTKDIVVSKMAAYILTEDGELLQLTTSQISPMEVLGEVEAMTVTTAGHLLIGIRNKGIYEYSGDWRKTFSSPYPSTEGEHWAYLAESEGQVAFAITSKPTMVGQEKWKYTGQTTLWVSKGSELKEIPLGKL